MVLKEIIIIIIIILINNNNSNMSKNITKTLVLVLNSEADIFLIPLMVQFW